MPSITYLIRVIKLHLSYISLKIALHNDFLINSLILLQFLKQFLNSDEINNVLPNRLNNKQSINISNYIYKKPFINAYI